MTALSILVLATTLLMLSLVALVIRIRMTVAFTFSERATTSSKDLGLDALMGAMATISCSLALEPTLSQVAPIAMASIQ